MLEKRIEGKCKQFVEKNGGYMFKLGGLGCVGLPDRLVLLPGGKVAFVEFKQPGKVPKPHQDRWLQRLDRLGFEAWWCDSYVDFILRIAVLL